MRCRRGGSPSSSGPGSTPWPRSRTAWKEPPMIKPSYVYVTYILTTPEKVWAALTQPELTRQYWGRANVSDWKVGSAGRHELPGEERAATGEVVESDPPHRLVTSWWRPAEA